MPHIVINMYPGRSRELKKKMAETVRQQFAEAFGMQQGNVSAAVKEIAPDDFEKNVKETYIGQEILAESDYIKSEPVLNRDIMKQ